MIKCYFYLVTEYIVEDCIDKRNNLIMPEVFNRNENGGYAANL